MFRSHHWKSLIFVLFSASILVIALISIVEVNEELGKERDKGLLVEMFSNEFLLLLSILL